MMIARTMDMGVGICVGHLIPIPAVGFLMATCSTVTCENKNVGLVGDIVVSTCGDIGIMLTCASTVTAEGRPVVRAGDAFAGVFSGVLMTSNSTVIAS